MLKYILTKASVPRIFVCFCRTPPPPEWLHRCTHICPEMLKLKILGTEAFTKIFNQCISSNGKQASSLVFIFPNKCELLLYCCTLLQTLIYIFGDMLNCVGAAGKVFDYLDRTPEVSTEGSLQSDFLQGHVQFQNITFSYPTRHDQMALNVRKQ